MKRGSGILVAMRWTIPFTILLVSAACTTVKPGPDDVLRRYTDATTHARMGEAWQLLCAKDRAWRPLAKMEEAGKQLADPNAQTVLAKTRFQTGTITIDGDRATVVQTTIGPDLAAIIRKAQSEPGNNEKIRALTPEQARVFGQKLLADAVAAPDCPMTRTDATVHLVRESGEWKVDAGFEEHDRADPVLRDLAGHPPE